MSVSLSGQLPGGDGNGLVTIIDALIRDGKRLHVAIAILDSPKHTTNNDTGETVPTVRIRRIEVITGAGDKQVAEQLMRRALEARTGREALPYELEQEITSAFKDAENEES